MLFNLYKVISILFAMVILDGAKAHAENSIENCAKFIGEWQLVDTGANEKFVKTISIRSKGDGLATVSIEEKSHGNSRIRTDSKITFQIGEDAQPVLNRLSTHLQFTIVGECRAVAQKPVLIFTAHLKSSDNVISKTILSIDRGVLVESDAGSSRSKSIRRFSRLE